MKRRLLLVIPMVSTGCMVPITGTPSIGETVNIYIKSLQSTDEKIASSAAKRLFSAGEHAIPELIKLLESNASYYGHFQSAKSGAIIDDSDPSQRCTIGIVSLYLIYAIYEENINFASSLRLVELEDTTKFINNSWLDKGLRELSKWNDRRKKIGLKRMRESSDAPLSSTNIRFY